MNNDIQALYQLYLKYPNICTDSRKPESNSIFFGLRGENFIGSKYAEAAINNGCAFAVVDAEEFKKDDRYIVVPDVLECLQQLAMHHRKQLEIPVIGITGSNGKTTTKELIGTVLSQKYNCFYTKGNLNNHIGVPLSILSIHPEIEIAVIEMGANHIGEIEVLCQIAQPGYGIITNIGKAHLEGFGSYEGVIKAKSELYQYILAHDGKVFVNLDNPLLNKLSGSIDRVSFGTQSEADCQLEIITSDPFLNIQWKYGSKKLSLHSKLIGDYNFENMMAAVCIGNHFQVDAFQITDAIAAYTPANHRSQYVETENNRIIMDAYNANPSSMESALRNFAGMQMEHKMLILGEMLELGDESDKEHSKLVELIKQLGFTNVHLIGPCFNDINDFPVYKDADDFLNNAINRIATNQSILIKGSRGNKLETLLEHL